MKILIVSIFITSLSFALPKQSEVSEILTNVFYEQIYNKTKDIPIAHENTPKKESLNKGERGSMIIERMKQRNREKLAAMRGYDPSKVKTGKDLVKLQKDDNVQALKKMQEAQKQYESNLSSLKGSEKEAALLEIESIRNHVLTEHKNWRDSHKKTLEEWEKEKKNYLKDVKTYEQSLAEIPLVLPVSTKDQKKKVEVIIPKEIHFISNSLEIPIRDQKGRPTCSSFAGVRALEVKLAQKNEYQDLSEQYFYWSSKSECQNRKCTNGGSWVGNGMKYSQDSSLPNIPLEKDCPYNPSENNSNQTQIPLNSTCSNGEVKVREFKYIKNLNEVVDALKNNEPVLASFKLTPNFYANTGLVLDAESSVGSKMDSHALGHTVLLIGYMKLPKVLNEGSVCFVTANSWGFGWGYGGHSCISEKWIINNRQKNPFVVINNIATRS